MVNPLNPLRRPQQYDSLSRATPNPLHFKFKNHSNQFQLESSYNRAQHATIGKGHNQSISRAVSRLSITSRSEALHRLSKTLPGTGAITDALDFDFRVIITWRNRRTGPTGESHTTKTRTVQSRVAGRAFDALLPKRCPSALGPLSARDTERAAD